MPSKRSIFSNKCNDIKNRKKANDVILTPPKLAINHIEYVKPLTRKTYIWYDPFKNTGCYYNNYPVEEKYKKWSEILLNKDFFEFNEKVDVIVTNPPFSIINKIFEKFWQLKPKIISLLIGVLNLTAKRIDDMKKHGYKLVQLKFCKVQEWFGAQYIVTFELNSKRRQVVDFDRSVYYAKEIQKTAIKERVQPENYEPIQIEPDDLSEYDFVEKI